MSNDRDRIRRTGGSGYNDNDPNYNPPPNNNWLLKLLGIGLGVFGLIALLNNCQGPKVNPELAPSPSVSTSPVVPEPTNEPTTGTTTPDAPPSTDATPSTGESVPPFVGPLPEATVSPEPSASPTDAAPNGGNPESPKPDTTTSPSASKPLDMDDSVKRSSYESDDKYYADLAIKATKDSETVKTKLSTSGLTPAQTTYLKGLYDKYVMQAEVYNRLSTDDVKK